jgi:hypothetical protein
VTLRASDDRPGAADELKDAGQRTVFAVRAERDGEPVRGAEVELVADPFPFEGDEEVVARARTSAAGRARLDARFDRRVRVRARVADGVSDTVAIRRSPAYERASVEERPDGLQQFEGVMRFPRDLDPEFRFVAFVGDAERPRLPRIDPRITVDEPRPGQVRARFAFRLPEGVERWRLQVCVAADADSGLSAPRGRCRGRTAVNEEYEDQRRAEREERRADRGRDRRR